MIARSMNEYGVSPQQVATATQAPLADVQARYQAAMGPNAGIARRPGSGGVTYFSPMVYTPQAAAAPAAAQTATAADPGADAPVADPAAAAPVSAAAPAAPNTWGTCLEYLTTQTEFKDMVNPFTGKAPVFITACNPADHSLVGSIVIDKVTPNPPGSAVATVTSQLLATDPIADKMQLKIAVCDKGSYAIKIAELEF